MALGRARVPVARRERNGIVKCMVKVSNIVLKLQYVIVKKPS